jgi:hypothetical protein
MLIHVPDHTSMVKQSSFPVETRILAGSDALGLFDLGYDGDFAWSEFQEALSEEFRTCLQESLWPALVKACSESIRSRRVASTHAVLRSPMDGRNYTPVLNRVEISGNNSAAFHITFMQVAAGTQAAVRDKSVANAKSAGQGGNGAPAGDAGGLGAIWEAIRLIETESRNRGVYDEAALPTDFGPDEDRVRRMFPLWHEKRALLERRRRGRENRDLCPGARRAGSDQRRVHISGVAAPRRAGARRRPHRQRRQPTGAQSSCLISAGSSLS